MSTKKLQIIGGLGSGSIDIDFDISNEGEPNPINADTLGGVLASEYAKKEDLQNIELPTLVELNYAVVGSVTEPENPTQNMIWINTNNTIGKVFFGNAVPNEVFVNGDCWIETGSSSNAAFNSLKIGDIYTNMIYPIAAKQYVSGAWVDMETKSYQGGEWVDWITYLFASGSGEKVEFCYFTNNSASVTETKDYVLVDSKQANGGYEVLWFTENPVDLNDVSEVVFEAKCTYRETNDPHDYCGQFILLDYKPTTSGALPSPMISSTHLVMDNKNTEYSLKVPNGGGNYYVGYWGRSTTEIYNIFLR